MNQQESILTLPGNISAKNLFITIATLILGVASLMHSRLASADFTVDIDDRVSVEFSDMVVGQTVKTYQTNAVIRNDSENAILPPIRLLIFDIDKKNTTVSNADGLASGGVPYIEVTFDGDLLAPGESTQKR